MEMRGGDLFVAAVALLAAHVNCQSSIVIAGGSASSTQSSAQVPSAACYTFDATENAGAGGYSQISSMSTARMGHAVVAVPGFVFAISGRVGVCTVSASVCALTQSVERLPIGSASAVWEAAADIPEARSYFGAAASASGGSVYVAGGDVGGVPLATTYMYDVALDAWSRVSDMSAARRDHVIAQVGDCVYAVGGRAGSFSSLSSVERYDPVSDNWSAMASMSTARRLPSAGVHGSFLYIVGGLDSSQIFVNQGLVNTAERFDASTNTWQSIAPMPNPGMFIASIASLDGLLYQFGGASIGFNYPKDALLYDTEADAWTALTQPPVTLAFHGVAAMWPLPSPSSPPPSEPPAPNSPPPCHPPSLPPPPQAPPPCVPPSTPPSHPA